MKKYSLKKSLVAVTLATAMTFNFTGCTTSNQNIDSNSNNSQTELNNQFLAENYYFVCIDGNVYFTTRELSESEDYFDYYDAKSGEFVGRILKPLQGEQIESTETTIIYNAKYDDSNHFCGEYGLGKLIPKCAFVPLSQLLSGSTFSKEDFDYFISNSDDLKRKIQDFGYYTSYEVEDNPVAWRIPWSDVTGGCKVVEKATMRRYDCELNDGTKTTYIGYQCSYNEHDSGYNYIYDILTGNIIYIGFGQKNKISSMEITDYNNEEHKSVSEIIEEIGLVSISTTPEKGDNESSTIFEASKLFVLDSHFSSIVTATENVKPYYFLLKTGEKEDEFDVYKDLYCEEAIVHISEDMISGMYLRMDNVQSELVDYVVASRNLSDSPLISIDTFLASYGLEDFISQNGTYSLETIDAIKKQVSVDAKQKVYQYEN